MELRKGQKQGRNDNLKPYPTTERCQPPFWPPMHALASLVHFVTYSRKLTRDASAFTALEAREWAAAGIILWGTVLEISHLCLVPVLLQLHPYLK